ncbi:MAG: IS1595 family transposase [Sphingobacteriales bacterium]|nr:MAG: IS1595 family transposase [Sphingobacteriales bacterium]
MIPTNRIFQFKSFSEMLKILPDETSCRNYLEAMIWEGVPACPHCACKNESHYKLKTKSVFKGMYKCKDCRQRFTVPVGTIFEGSHIDLRKWFIAIYIYTSHKKGISSHQLARDLGITQKSAWFMFGRIRFAFQAKTVSPKLDGVVQADESFIGGKNKNRHADKKIPESQGRSVKDKTPVFGVIQTGGKVHLTVVPDTKASTLKPIIQNLVREGAIVVTDEWNGYSGLSKDRPLVVINHKENEYVRGAFHTNSIENFWSLLKWGIYGIYHQVSPKHLHRYCDEFAYRFNSRKLNSTERFDVSLRNVSGRITYKELIRQ